MRRRLVIVSPLMPPVSVIVVAAAERVEGVV